MCKAEIEGLPCDSCGYAGAGGSEAAPTVVVNEPMVKFSRLIAQSDAQRWQTLCRWVKQALDKNHNPRAVAHKWRHCYREDLPASRLMAAIAEVQRDA